MSLIDKIPKGDDNTLKRSSPSLLKNIPPKPEKNLESDTKECPFCAETIKAKAVVCRFCGKALDGTSNTLKPEITSSESDRQLIQEFVTKHTNWGWEVISQTDTSVQLRKPKRWSSVLLILGVLLLVVFGAGLLFFILAIIDYAIKKDQTLFITVEQLRERKQNKSTQITKPPNPNQVSLLPLIFFLVLGAAALCWFIGLGV